MKGKGEPDNNVVFFRFMIAVFILFLARSVYAAEVAQDAVPRFDIVRYKVEGNTLLSKETVEKLLAPFTGKQKDFGTVQEALEKLEQQYRGLGYNTVQVILPEQELEKGEVRFKIIETRIGKVIIEDNKYFSKDNIRRSLPALREGKAPNLNDISASLRTANENPAKKVNLQLQNSEKEDEVDAMLKVKDEKVWKLGVSADNTGDKQTGESRIGYLFQYANIADRDHLLTLQYITSFEKPGSVGIYSAGYRIPLYELGDSIDLMAAYSDVDSGTIAAGTLNLQVSGKGRIYGIHYNHNLRRIVDYEQKFVYAFDYRSYENKVGLGSAGLGNDVTVHPLSVTYSGSLQQTWGEAGFNLGLAQNIPTVIGGRDNELHFERVRAGSSDKYRIFKYGANAGYLFPADWQGRFNLAGQRTDRPLVPGEQFGAGGASSVRGFHEREVSNDNGYSANLEVYTPDLCKLSGIDYAQARLLAFYDRGDISRSEPLQAGEKKKDLIYSAGMGLRVTGSRYFAMSLDYGYVLKPGMTNRTSGDGFWHVKGTLTY